MKDPDGNEWEVFVVKGDTDTMSDEPAAAKPCCTPMQKANAKASGGCCG